MTPIEQAVLKAYAAQREPIGDSDLDNEQPVTLMVHTTLGDLRKLYMQSLREKNPNATLSRALEELTGIEGAGDDLMKTLVDICRPVR